MQNGTAILAKTLCDIRLHLRSSTDTSAQSVLVNFESYNDVEHDEIKSDVSILCHKISATISRMLMDKMKCTLGSSPAEFRRWSSYCEEFLGL